MLPEISSSVSVEPDRIWVWLAAVSFLLVPLIRPIPCLREAPYVTGDALDNGAGFILQTIFLFERGHAIGRCPITNYFELLVFMSWSMVLTYLLIGSTYRLSLMGAFTAPVGSPDADLCSADSRRATGYSNYSQPMAGGAHIVFDNRLRHLRPRLYCRSHVPGSGTSTEDAQARVHLL